MRGFLTGFMLGHMASCGARGPDFKPVTRGWYAMGEGALVYALGEQGKRRFAALWLALGLAVCGAAAMHYFDKPIVAFLAFLGWCLALPIVAMLLALITRLWVVIGPALFLLCAPLLYPDRAVIGLLAMASVAGRIPVVKYDPLGELLTFAIALSPGVASAIVALLVERTLRCLGFVGRLMYALIVLAVAGLLLLVAYAGDAGWQAIGTILGAINDLSAEELEKARTSFPDESLPAVVSATLAAIATLTIVIRLVPLLLARPRTATMYFARPWIGICEAIFVLAAGFGAGGAIALFSQWQVAAPTYDNIYTSSFAVPGAIVGSVLFIWWLAARRSEYFSRGRAAAVEEAFAQDGQTQLTRALSKTATAPAE